ncbi:hypothetical protein [Microbispora sp. H13382]|uniref:hypothetical protein n=1 Tax=Microbispora sp. H13382 TaxID=2729112 RepID=UPI0015FECBE6|nr:hypothetical protein [Microbispora sp. H13382]
MTKIFEQFDSYSRHARIYPALITASPLATVLITVWNQSLTGRLMPVLVTFGGLFFTANYVRSAGKSLESRLIREWDGLPTTRLLRHRNNPNPPLALRRKRALHGLTGISFPSPAREERDPKGADDLYVTAVRVLIARVRDKDGSYKRVHEENMNYGFRRNLLALRPIGITITILCLVIDFVIWRTGRATASQVLIAAAIHTVFLLAWASVVKASWVYQAGEAYAERLFDTLEDPEILASKDETADQ